MARVQHGTDSSNLVNIRHMPYGRLLIVGGLCTAILALLTVGISMVELARVEQESATFADEGLRATNQLANVGERLARLRAQVLLVSPRGSDSRLFASTESSLQEAIDGLATGLDPVSRQRWATLRGEVRQLRDIYAEAVVLTRTGQTASAADLLARHVDDAARVHNDLENLEQAHAQQLLRVIDARRERTARARVLAAIAGAAFFAGLIAIWGLVFRVLHRQGRELADRAARLESANADLDAFAGRVAHDLKNALGPIVMAPELLRRSPTNTSRVLDIADRTERCSRRAVAVVDSLLAFSRAAHLVGGDESGSVKAAVNDVLEEITPRAEQLGVAIEVDDIPDLHVRCSPGLLHIVLANLVGNAVKYLERQSEKRVHITVRQDGAACRIEVEDTGPGIAWEEQAKIFEPFYRVPGSSAPGTGIGLATVRRILDARGGRIALESTQGRGSRFVAQIPLASSRLVYQPPSTSDGSVPASVH